jgi:hypothetical protein
MATLKTRRAKESEVGSIRIEFLLEMMAPKGKGMTYSRCWKKKKNCQLSIIYQTNYPSKIKMK